MHLSFRPLSFYGLFVAFHLFVVSSELMLHLHQLLFSLKIYSKVLKQTLMKLNHMVHLNLLMVHLNLLMVHLNHLMVHLNHLMVHLNHPMVHLNLIIHLPHLPHMVHHLSHLNLIQLPLHLHQCMR